MLQKNKQFRRDSTISFCSPQNAISEGQLWAAEITLSKYCFKTKI